MSIELHYRLHSDVSKNLSTNQFKGNSDMNCAKVPIFESSVWLPNAKVPIKVLQKVIYRQILLSLNEIEFLKNKFAKKETSFVLFFNNIQLDPSQILHKSNIKNDDLIDVYFMNETSSTTSKIWGYGMTCASASSSSSSVLSPPLSFNQKPKKKPSFGSIFDVPVGTWWRYRSQASEAGVHAPLVASLSGKSNVGVYSLIFSAQYSEDVDLGDQLYFSGTGGRHLTSGRRVPSELIQNQKLTGLNKALAMNCATNFRSETPGNAGDKWRDGLPVRILRNGNGRVKNSKYLPKIGVRYDGLYKVVKYWPEIVNNFRMWKFLFRRDDPEPAPWSEKGRYQRRKLGLESPLYPIKWNRSIAGQRRLKTDLEISQKSIKQSRVPESIIQLLKSLNCSKFNKLLRFKNSRKSFEKAIQYENKCSICLKHPPNEPIGLKTCFHIFCSVCLESSRVITNFNCPSCQKNNDDNDNEEEEVDKDGDALKIRKVEISTETSTETSMNIGIELQIEKKPLISQILQMLENA